MIQIELNKMYHKNGGDEKNCSRFIKKLTAYMNNELPVFTSPGTASSVILHEKKSMF